MSNEYAPPSLWMGSKVPEDVRAQWLGVAGKYWRIGVLDALKAVNKDHDLSAMVGLWAPGERADRVSRAEARKS